ncbi:RNA methyltransferase [Limibacillus sp. MBR-115]|jgi:tRNA/rRNA methyltransferase|uniref:RNA methyltransferase n=1 Tax=Limibacillus sp. MBR-115 TaxID=3156465 RepID=UPI0033990CCF
MAGTDRSRPEIVLDRNPVVVLVRPQLGENIGMVARAMMNCGLGELRLVEPRDGWPNEASAAPASGALPILQAAKLYDSVTAALEDCHKVYVTTARQREMIKQIMTPKAAVRQLRQQIADGMQTALVFGPERTGLESDEVALADTIIEVPLNPSFSSLNLAQAVLVIGYEWYQSGDDTPEDRREVGHTPPADHGEIDAFFERLVDELDTVNFFWPEHKRQAMLRNLRSLVNRLEPTQQDVRTLHGIVSALIEARQRRKGMKKG